MPTVVHHSTMLPLPGADEAPEWVHLLPAGEFRGVDGRGPYRLRDAAKVITTTAAMAGGKLRLPLDENHAIDHAMRTGQSSPARGWVVELQARQDGIWGRVEWTPTGKALLRDRAYRGISPVYGHAEADGTVLYLLRAALTNAPNLAQLATLHTQQGTGMDLTQLREALGLPATTADADVLSAAVARQGVIAAHQQQLCAALALPATADHAAILAAVTTGRAAVAAHGQQLSRIAAAAGITEANAGAEQIVTALQARTGDPNLAATVVSLQTQLATLQQSAAREAATRAVDDAIKAGKPIKPLREHYIARHMQDPAAVASELAALPSINAGGLASVVPPASQDGLSTDDHRAIALMGISPEAFIAERKRQAEGIA